MPISLEDSNDDKNFRGLFIGPTGTGKTCMACSFPGKILVFDFDKRFKPLKTFYPERLKEIEIEVITTKNYRTTFHTMVNDLQNNNPYDLILLDGITGLSTTTVVMQMEMKGDYLSGGSGAGGGKVVKGGISVPSWDEFNGEAMIITGLLESLKSLKCNLIVTAHPIHKADMKGNKWRDIVAYGTKTGPMIPGYFDNVFYFDYDYDGVMSSTGAPKRKVYTRPTQEFPGAKNAYQEMPGVIDVTVDEGLARPGQGLYEKIKDYIR